MSNGSNSKAFKVIGTRPVRHDGLDKVTGRANYGADFNLPGMLFGKLLRSPHAHALIKSIDTSAAEKLPGVHAVATSTDLPEMASEMSSAGEAPTDYKDISQNILARRKVLYHGHAVAAVAAATSFIAEQALGLIKVEYEVLPHVLDVREAMQPDAPLLHQGMFTAGIDPTPTRASNVAKRAEHRRGDIEAAFKKADVVIEREYTTSTIHQGYIEPHACVARWTEDGQTLVWASSQGHFMIREEVAKLLKMDVSKIKVIPAEIGGGFGGKTLVYIEPVAVILSRKSGRPVKIVMTRDEVFRATGPGPASYIKCKIGATKDGVLLAGHAYMAYEAGGFPGSAVGAGMMAIFACYKLDHLLIEGFDVVVNKPKSAPYRAPGAPNAAHASETIMDEIAEKLGMDPLEFRLKNAATKGVKAPWGPPFPEIGCKETLEAASTHPHYTAPLGENQGRGVACGWWMNAGGLGNANIVINTDGTASVVTGCPDIGGSRASMAIIAAEELGIAVTRVRPLIADTETIGDSGVTGGSRVTYASGWAVMDASHAVIKELKKRAAALWEVSPDTVEWRGGAAHLTNGAGSNGQAPLTLKELGAKAGSTGGTITGSASINAKGAAAAFGTHIVDVEVDPGTGQVRILRYTVVQDAGRAIHPAYVEGQMQGGAAQGVGWALNEEFVFGKDGVMENAGFLDYRMPTALDLPMIDTVIVEVPNPTHPYGVRGVGEVPIVPPIPAIANAIYHAIGVRLLDLPMSPPRVLAALLTKQQVPVVA